MVYASVAGVGGMVAYLYIDQNKQHARNWHSNAHMMYPASANFPDLTKHHNAIAKFLTPGVRLLCDLYTSGEIVVWFVHQGGDCCVICWLYVMCHLKAVHKSYVIYLLFIMCNLKSVLEQIKCCEIWI